ncbi:MAG: helix-turn-helix transcriptional regulator [Lachnospiraceae bacterium]|jgi:predicted transcriptional regulator|nr:helix-turn-helix transcriptional regulator [Lachnospiraceae bacterium]MBQ3973321.1 helix-turn-helix transcriptional regulator [Lachnospiraceae bacterium]MBQ4304354.1 helix-turn-helix transcriptional regulator [Lachnospiraceae bacterium]
MESDKNKTQVLKTVILQRYRSVRQFAAVMDIPYSTLVTALERGIEGMAYSTVIRMCEALELNPVDFSPLEESDGLSGQIITRKVMEKYNKLNRAGRRKVLEYMDDYAQIPAYTMEDPDEEDLI